jgi:hypothetical protein
VGLLDFGLTAEFIPHYTASSCCRRIRDAKPDSAGQARGGGSAGSRYRKKQADLTNHYGVADEDYL